MATCDGERFLDAQLESIAAQSLPPDELVVSDDASSDATFERAKDFAARAGFEVRLQRNPARLGITRNFERAIAACTGDVILLADQDDVWLPEKVETLCGVLAREPGTGAVFCDGEVVDASLSPQGTTLWQALGFDASERARVREGEAARVFLRHVVAAGTTLAFRARFREDALPFPDLRSCHDAFTAFVIAGRARIALVERPLIRYRVHGDNQIGIRRLGLRDQLAKAREQVSTDSLGYAIEFFETARARLADADPELLRAIDDKLDHARKRRDLPPHGIARLGAIRRELRSGRYGRYSYGWKSVAQDLFLR